MESWKGVMIVREKNLELTRRGYDLFSKGDLGALRAELFTEDIIWRTCGVSVFEPEYKGVDAVIEYLTQLAELSGGTFKAEPVHILADDDRAVAIQHILGTREGKLLDGDMVLVFEIRDEKVYEVTEYTPQLTMLDAFWA